MFSDEVPGGGVPFVTFFGEKFKRWGHDSSTKDCIFVLGCCSEGTLNVRWYFLRLLCINMEKRKEQARIGHGLMREILRCMIKWRLRGMVHPG